MPPSDLWVLHSFEDCSRIILWHWWSALPPALSHSCKTVGKHGVPENQIALLSCNSCWEKSEMACWRRPSVCSVLWHGEMMELFLEAACALWWRPFFTLLATAYWFYSQWRDRPKQNTPTNKHNSNNWSKLFHPDVRNPAQKEKPLYPFTLHLSLARALPLTHYLPLFALRFSSFVTLALPRDKQKCFWIFLYDNSILFFL